MGSGGFNFAGGTLNANNVTDNSIGALILTVNSTLNLSPGGASATLTFTGVSGDANGILTITGWSGSTGGLGLNDKIIFSGGTIPDADFLQHIHFDLGDGNIYFGALGEGGELFPSVIIVVTKIFLEGPYNSGSMNTILNPLLPNNQPYNVSTWNYNGLESVESGFFSSHLNIVDWVLLEIKNSSFVTMETRAAFLNNNGTIVDLDGTSPVEFKGRPDGDYYIVVKHRNHLSIMSKNIQPLNSSSSMYDFTTDSGQFYEGNVGAKDLGSGVWGMIAGDGNGNGQVQNDDSENIWKPDNGTSGYRNADYNMNGQVQNDDNENYWKPNNGRGSQVP